MAAEFYRQESEIETCYDYPGVCKIVLSADEYGTGFLTNFTLRGNDTHGLFTNNHVVSKIEKVLTLEFHLHRKSDYLFREK